MKQDQPGWGQYLSANALGIEVGAALAVGLGVGWWLDQFFHTGPWLLVIFTGLGIAAGFRNLIKYSRDKMREVEGDGKSDKTNSP